MPQGGMAEGKHHKYRCPTPRMLKARRQGWLLLKGPMKSMAYDEILQKLWLGLHSIENDHKAECGEDYIY
jgi:hypothetical protein